VAISNSMRNAERNPAFPLFFIIRVFPCPRTEIEFPYRKESRLEWTEIMYINLSTNKVDVYIIGGIGKKNRTDSANR
jgi:hypothetical protein